MTWLKIMLLLLVFFSPAIASSPESLTIAAASDLRFALDDILDQYKKKTPGLDIKVIYGSSGKMTTQIMNGAPYDVFFSADIAFPERLFAEHFAVTEPEVYAVGRIVIWSRKMDASNMALHDLLDASIRRVAIAQPSHAPYGLRAQEAMIAAGIWEAIQPKLVFGENIAHTAQMVESEAADVGIIALSLALFPDLATRGYHLIDDGLHNPLTQAYVVTHHGRNNAAAHAFANYMTGDEAHTIMARYGFVLPGFNPQGQ
jgi:molybdate transport system substrate-binding protein